MAVAIRLSRGGAKKRPYYKIVVADARNARDGKFIERIGSYNPLLAKDDPERVKLDYDKAIACTGRAGTISIHHTLAVHGSAANTSPFPRPFLLYEFMAADAWPLMGVKDVEEFDSRMICGSCPL